MTRENQSGDNVNGRSTRERVSELYIYIERERGRERERERERERKERKRERESDKDWKRDGLRLIKTDREIDRKRK